jgi:hypothetical protein
MSGLLRRIRRTRTPADEPAPDKGAAWDEAERPTGEQPGGDDAWRDTLPELPAGSDLDRLVGERPTSRRRGRLRRRLRHLRRVREVLLRDLGGMTFEIHRSDEHSDRAQALVQDKLARLANVDAELRELREILDDHGATVLREPGIGGSCPLCGELYGSEARYCWACGTPIAPGAVRPVTSTGAVPALPKVVETRDDPPPPEPADDTRVMDAEVIDADAEEDAPPAEPRTRTAKGTWTPWGEEQEDEPA